MLRSFRLAFALALVFLLAVAGVAAGCGSSSSSSSSSASPSANTTKAYKIGITQIVTHPALDAAVQGFKDALAEKGFTNVTYDVQNAQGDMATAASIAQKFASEKLDLILGVATPTTQAVVKAVTTTPIVFTAVTDPVGAGLVTDPKAPTANVTGVSDLQPVEPILKLAKAFNPNAKNVGIVYNAGESNSVFIVKQAEAAASALGLTMVKAPASTSAEVQAAAQSLVGRVDAIAVIGDNTAVSALEAIVKVCDQNKIPLHRRRHRQRQARRRCRLRLRLQGPRQAGRLPGRPDPQRHADQGHPGRVRQEPAALDQREGRGGAGRHHPRRPGEPGRQQVLIFTRSRQPRAR